MEGKGFLRSLFDLSFTTLVTPKVIKLIYLLTLITIAIGATLFIIGAFAENTAFGVLTLLILAPIFALFYTIYARVILEFLIAVFRLTETNAELVALKRIEMRLDVPSAAEPLTDPAT